MTLQDDTAHSLVFKPGDDGGYEGEVAGFQTGLAQRPAVVFATGKGGSSCFEGEVRPGGMFRRNYTIAPARERA
ncbi:hypothetical protein [Streptomyces bluensis]|uniref:Uncharacterized protein n=1 Tax=Streptomyces bluensis TaxID=33897 RepID=A0ABW6UD48_9ACTN